MTYTQTEREAAELAGLREGYPGWNVWRASGGAWMASRRAELDLRQVRAGCSPTLMEDTCRRLWRQLEAESLADRHTADGYLCSVDAAWWHLLDGRACCGVTGGAVGAVERL
ncbi:hypothetical protein LO762_04385 [Actinocorallia sp. API 0066]|uniref:hypothetical protein n=1 Tax=Actinocorallia sp. API 0066 TaxID=2896846 RepID=UPI001E569554|nr:hypothetical protein [Actinocorallia sp. API 0066]MCD0448438.1 hypothetical protein [Actinocorallia sp. API 0066]